MAYASESDIESEFKDLDFSSSSAVTSNEVIQFLSDADAEINARLNGRYTVPITGTVALSIVKVMEIYLVKHRILEILKVKTGRAPEEQEGSKTYREMALDMIKDILENRLALYDAVGVSGGGVASYNLTNDISPVFERDGDQW